MTCLPCVKEIINSSAAHRVENLRTLSKSVPDMVKRGQITKDFAEEWLKKVIKLEYDFCEDGERLEKEFTSTAKNPWDV